MLDVARVADPHHVAAEAGGQKEVEKAADQERAGQPRDRKIGPVFVEDQFPAQRGKQEAEGVQCESQGRHGPADAAEDADDLLRAGDVQHQVEQQAEAENDFKNEKEILALHARVRG